MPCCCLTLTVHALLLPFLCRNVLDILRNNSRLEALYSMVAARACQVRLVLWLLRDCGCWCGWCGRTAAGMAWHGMHFVGMCMACIDMHGTAWHDISSRRMSCVAMA